MADWRPVTFSKNIPQSPPDLLRLMELGLGDPSNKYPRGCVHLLAGCIDRMPDGNWVEVEDLRAPARQLFVKFIQVIIAISSKPPISGRSGGRDLPNEYMGRCYCMDGKQRDTLREALLLHRAIRKEDSNVVFDRIWRSIASALSYRQTHKLQLPGASTRRSSTDVNHTHWPINATELLPRPFDDSFAALLRWSDPSSDYRKFMCLTMETFRAELMSPLLRVPMAPSWLRWVNNGAGAKMKMVLTLGNYDEYCACLENLCHIVMTLSDVMFDHKLRAWWTANETIDPAKSIEEMDSYYRHAQKFASHPQLVNSSASIMASLDEIIPRAAGPLLHALGLTEKYA